MNLRNKAANKRIDNENALQIACPACQRQIAWHEDNPHRPFCTERCKTADFMAWANEEQRIPGTYADDNEDDGGGTQASI